MASIALLLPEPQPQADAPVKPLNLQVDRLVVAPPRPDYKREILLPLHAYQAAADEAWSKLEDDCHTKGGHVDAHAKCVVPLPKPVVVDMPTQSASEAPAASPRVSGGSCETYRPLVAQYGWDVNVAMAVMQAESGCNAYNENATDRHPTCLGSRGLFQIGCDSTDDYAGMFNASENVAHAYSMYSTRGWSPWGAYTSGAYRRYL